MTTVFDYDDNRDSLFISIKKKNERVQGSAKLGELALDFTREGRIVGIEIIHVSDFLKKFDIDAESMKKIEEAELAVSYRRDSIAIWVYLKIKGKKETKFPIFVSTETPSAKLAVA